LPLPSCTKECLSSLAFQAAFSDPVAAVAACVDVQRALDAEPWPETGPMRVRMALDRGEADPSATGDYQAPVLHRLGALLAAGQHLKRGVLLYGPPGTGKTHTVRYLLAQMTEVTTILLSGVSLRFVGAAAELAVALQPALIVLEDVDLVAEHRDLESDAQPLLFTLMEAMDGLAGDADVAFLLTTNRADLLEPALAQRPGRVDLAVEIPLPDRPARVALLRLYARGLPLSPDVLDDAADRTEGITASFVKELLRRTTLLAIEEGRPVTDADLISALDELHHDRETLTRTLLGSPAKVR
jgi:ATP-dependent 26S proteasome regulatory subunit